MASSPVAQIAATSFDLYGASVVSATASAVDPRKGVLYDNTILAAGSPVHVHPVSPTKFLIAFSRIWSAATPSSTQVGFFSSYTQSTAPTWLLADNTGNRTLIGSSPTIPIKTSVDSITLIDGCSRPPDFVFLLHSVVIGGVTQGLLQHFHFSVNSRLTPIAEELIPNLSAAGVTFDKGIAYTTPYLTVFGTDDDGHVFKARKPWGSVGASSFTSAQQGTHSVAWQYGTGDGWSPTPGDAAYEPGLLSFGPVSHARWRNTTYLATVTESGVNRSSQIYTRIPGGAWKQQGSPLALGSTSDGSYLGGTMQLQSQMGATPSMVDTPASETAFPYCVSKKTRVSSQDTLGVTWGLLQVPRQT